MNDEERKKIGLFIVHNPELAPRVLGYFSTRVPEIFDEMVKFYQDKGLIPK